MGRNYGTWKTAYYACLIGMRLLPPEFKGDYWRIIDDTHHVRYRFNTVEEAGEAVAEEMCKRGVRLNSRSKNAAGSQ